MCALLVGCTSVGSQPFVRANAQSTVDTRRATALEVPFFAQERYQCGPAALAMALAFSGIDVTPDELVAEVYTRGRKGSFQTDLVASTRRHDRVAYVIRGVDELDRELVGGHPVIVLQNLGLSWLPRMHFAVVIGSTADGAYLLHSGRRQAVAVGEHTFLTTWARAGAWGLLVLRPGEIAATATERRWLDALAGLEQAGSLAAAREGYRLALLRWPGSLGAAIGLANTAYAERDLEQAETVLRDVLRLHPGAAAAWNNLAQVLADMGRLAEARAAVERAIELGGTHKETYESTLREIDARRAAERF